MPYLMCATRKWVVKQRGCIKYCKFIRPEGIRQLSRKAQPAVLPPEKLQNDEVLLSLQKVLEESNKHTNTQLTSAAAERQASSASFLPLVLGKAENPVLYIKSNNQLLDLGTTANKTTTPDLAFHAKDIERLLSLYDSHDLLPTKELKPAATTLFPTSATVALPEEQKKLKLVNALSPQELEWREQIIDFQKLPKCYLMLSKIRLTGLVVLTAVGGYVMAPGVLDPSVLLLASLGTGLTSAAANTINQFFEVPFDSQMNRTKNRVLVKGVLTPLHAVTFAGVSALTGLSLLYYGANSITAALGLTNLVLYTLIYTPMKRYSILNTWVGSVVGAIPPVMGWVACTGMLDSGAQRSFMIQKASRVLGRQVFAQQVRLLHTGTSVCKKVPTDGKQRPNSSNSWLTRQLNDPYVKWAKYKNYRARSAFKLIEIDDRHEFLQPGIVVVDCGAAPGAWTQVAVERTNANHCDNRKAVGKVVAVDIQGLAPVEGAVMLPNLDLTLPASREKVVDVLQGKAVDVLLSDMAPSASGIKQLDHDNSTALVYCALHLALQTLAVGGTGLFKMLQSGNTNHVETDLLKYFASVHVVKPPASRKESGEIFLLARGFKMVK